MRGPIPIATIRNLHRATLAAACALCLRSLAAGDWEPAWLHLAAAAATLAAAALRWAAEEALGWAAASTAARLRRLDPAARRRAYLEFSGRSGPELRRAVSDLMGGAA